jgi:phosphoribosylformylglycinamidine synthase
VAIPSTLLITARGQVDDVEQCVTMDLKGPGNLLYLIGETKAEFGGSHFNLVHGRAGGCVPTVDSETAPRIFRAVHQAIRQGLVLSCHDLSEGGLAVAAAEMAFAGGVGVRLKLKQADILKTLFSESNTRFVVEIEPSCESAFLKSFQGLPVEHIGETTATTEMEVSTGQSTQVVKCPLSELKTCWQSAIGG